jgi:hypothetical protein
MPVVLPRVWYLPVALYYLLQSISHGALYVGPIQYICQAGHCERPQVNVHVFATIDARKKGFLGEYIARQGQDSLGLWPCIVLIVSLSEL